MGLLFAFVVVDLVDVNSDSAGNLTYMYGQRLSLTHLPSSSTKCLTSVVAVTRKKMLTFIFLNSSSAG